MLIKFLGKLFAHYFFVMAFSFVAYLAVGGRESILIKDLPIVIALQMIVVSYFLTGVIVNKKRFNNFSADELLEIKEKIGIIVVSVSGIMSVFALVKLSMHWYEGTDAIVHLAKAAINVWYPGISLYLATKIVSEKMDGAGFKDAKQNDVQLEQMSSKKSFLKSYMIFCTLISTGFTAYFGVLIATFTLKLGSDPIESAAIKIANEKLNEIKVDYIKTKCEPYPEEKADEVYHQLKIEELKRLRFLKK